jgi:hypothetical protein
MPDFPTSELHPNDNKCHIRFRLGSLLDYAGSDRIDLLLDLTYPMAESERVSELTSIVSDRLLPVIERESSVAGLRALLDDGVFRAAGVRGPAPQLLAAASYAVSGLSREKPSGRAPTGR